MKKTKQIVATICLAVYISMSQTVYRVLANGDQQEEGTVDASSVLQPIYTIINIFITALQAVGVFIFAKNLAEFAVATKMGDDPGAASAAKGMVAGVLLVSIRILLGLCGISLGG